jgi:hypothetical protein
MYHMLKLIQGPKAFARQYLLLASLLLTASQVQAHADHDHSVPANVNKLSTETPSKLDDAWQNLIDGLIKAKATLEDPKHYPPAPTDRVMAEGYRYLLGHLNRSIEFEMRADPMFPEFFRSMDMLRKWTGENPDTMYLKAPIDGSGYYKITGTAANTKEWKTSQRGVKGNKAPRLVTFQTVSDVPGHSGELAEMANCKSQTLDFINSLSMSFDRKGRFELLVGPEKPADYKGDFLLSKKLMACKSTKANEVKSAKWLAVREIFSDWENEVPLDMDIVRLDSVGKNRPPITVDQMVEKINYIAEEVPNQIRFWNLVMEFPLEIVRDANRDGTRALPVNDINPPAPPFTAGGVAGAKQIYAAGVFNFADDEALVLKITSPVEPHYIAFQLNNLWMEGPDQQNYVSSLTGHQLPVASDGSRYYIIAHQDPGVQGWVDTTDLKEGFFAMRFVFREDPDTIELPSSEATLVKLSELASVLPADTPKVSAEDRAKEIAVRQAHIKKRWRAF